MKKVKKISVNIPKKFDFLNKKIISSIVDTTISLANPDIEAYDISIIFMSEDEISEVNRQLRDKHKSTNVISINYEELPMVLGEIFVCADVLEKEANEQDKSYYFHSTHLLVHSVLHLLEFDHQDEQEQEKMENLEKDILKKLGFEQDPYK